MKDTLSEGSKLREEVKPEEDSKTAVKQQGQVNFSSDSHKTKMSSESR